MAGYAHVSTDKEEQENSFDAQVKYYTEYIQSRPDWEVQRVYTDGKVTMAFGQFLGYDKGEDGTPVIDEDEAQIVRLIFKLCIDGKTPSAIARYLMAHNIPSPAGKKTW